MTRPPARTDHDSAEPSPDDLAGTGYRGDELVVGAGHLPLVLGLLDGLGVATAPPDVDDVLDLARVRLRRPTAEAADAVLTRCADRHAGDPDAWRDGCPGADRPLDRLLWGLRHLTGHDHGGWTPTLGKNRLMGRVHGVGEIIHGSAGDPSAVGDWTAPTRRPGGPGQGVRVGVLDTGLYPQPFLAGGWRARFSDLLGAEGAGYADGHATFVTGLVLAQAPAATVEVRGALRGPDGSADTWTVATEAVRFARSGIDVLNLSLACYTEDGQPPLLIARAIERLSAQLVVVAAAGNHGALPGDVAGVPVRSLPAFPAALDGVLAVGAGDAEGRRAPFSPDQPWVDVLAPGVDVRSTYLRVVAGGSAPAFDGWARWSGTSFAAALVTGAIAAGTDPGRVSAREALADFRAALARLGGTPTVAADGRVPAPPFVPLAAW
ncbi:hypothetical protein FHX74_003358 [Friedmanniella endophytica]|uniref:Peptidase S8/S53 domain-containing protein n=1 Tax=Microlunatus kandeliicorticis TaxID=1759536 RepID=A0A7W3IUY0_9ACTN|nr:S8 family serine peptidase [Microlunatus kandeliicorticis]MBA8795722.1 hypothetical protein [Microlunatus kandeliicorticis]